MVVNSGQQNEIQIFHSVQTCVLFVQIGFSLLDQYLAYSLWLNGSSVEYSRPGDNVIQYLINLFVLIIMLGEIRSCF